MTKRQQKANREKAAKWRADNPDKSIASSKNWKENNPGWWRGPMLVRWLTTALLNGNAKATIFRDAGLKRDEWICGLSDDVIPGGICELHEALSNGSKLAPIKHWREFDLNDPEQVKEFLAPGNFKLVAK